MKKESRRSFVKKTAAITTGVITSNLPIQSFANVGENKKLKLALVGCGGRWNMHRFAKWKRYF